MFGNVTNGVVVAAFLRSAFDKAVDGLGTGVNGPVIIDGRFAVGSTRLGTEFNGAATGIVGVDGATVGIGLALDGIGESVGAVI